MKIIKTTAKEYEIKQVSPNTMKYSKYFVDVRSEAEYKANKCFICNRKFEIGDNLHILFIKDNTNKVCCTNCAKDALNNI